MEGLMIFQIFRQSVMNATFEKMLVSSVKKDQKQVTTLRQIKKPEIMAISQDRKSRKFSFIFG